MERLVAVPNAEVDIRSLPIGPEEAFVLSRVDGNRTEDDIARETGLEKAVVTHILSRLVELGAVDLGLAGPRHGQRQAGASQKEIEASKNKVPSLYPANELKEEVALPRERRRQVLDWYYGFDLLDYYELLGLDPKADKKDVRESYFEIVYLFHPDKYFGKALGNYGSKLARVFQRLTEIQNILTVDELRREYDEKLARREPLSTEREAQRRVVAKRIRVYFTTARAARVEEKRREKEASGHARSVSKTPAGRMAAGIQTPAGGTHSTHPDLSGLTAGATERPNLPQPEGPSSGYDAEQPSALHSVPVPHAGPSAPPREPITITSQPPSDESRRRALVRKIRGSFPPNSQPSAVQAESNNPQRYLRMAEEAMARNNAVSAASALRIALGSMPDNKQIAARLAEAEQKAAAQMADINLEQARAEEVHGRFEVAAELYASVALGRPSAGVFERTAVCFLNAKKDLKRAADFAKQALALSPDRADYHFLLGRIYAEAKMQQSAINELERAAKLAPADASIKEWLKKLKRGEIDSLKG